MSRRSGEPLVIGQKKAQKVGAMLEKWPDRVYIVREEGDVADGVYVATTTPTGEHGDTVAIYDLVETKTIHISTELV